MVKPLAVKTLVNLAIAVQFAFYLPTFANVFSTKRISGYQSTKTFSPASKFFTNGTTCIARKILREILKKKIIPSFKISGHMVLNQLSNTYF